MRKTEHLQFLVLLIPTFVILAAAAVSMADLAFPAPSSELYAAYSYATEAAHDERNAE
jgi:hypothetical protein